MKQKSRSHTIWILSGKTELQPHLFFYVYISHSLFWKTCHQKPQPIFDIKLYLKFGTIPGCGNIVTTLFFHGKKEYSVEYISSIYFTEYSFFLVTILPGILYTYPQTSSLQSQSHKGNFRRNCVRILYPPRNRKLFDDNDITSA